MQILEKIGKWNIYPVTYCRAESFDSVVRRRHAIYAQLEHVQVVGRQLAIREVVFKPRCAQ